MMGNAFALQTTIPGVLVSTPPKIDGLIDETEWAGVTPNTGFVDEENSNKAAVVESVFWISYDAENLYFAIRNFDPNPSAIVANAYLPNSGMNGDDTVGVDIDVIGKLTDFNSFQFNARGANSMTLAGGKAAKTEWSGEFVTKSRITDIGWEAEVKIPWKLMRLPEKGKRDVRFNVGRYYPRDQRVYRWRNTNQKPDDIPAILGVEIPEVKLDRSLKVLQYGILGVGDTKPIFNTGFDFRNNLARNIEAVGTINPDFRNVTQGVQSLNFSYFEQLTDDNRPFFAEGADFFRSGGRGARIFASQRVKAFDVGAKIFGKIDDHTKFGIMNLAATGEENTTLVSISNNPTSRTSFDFSGVNFRSKTRDNTALFSNVGYGTGAYFFYVGNELTTDRQNGTAGKFKIGFNHGTNTSYNYGEFARVEKDFTPRLGFQPDKDLLGYSGGGGFNQRYSKGAISQSSFGYDLSKYFRTNGDRYRQEINLNFDLDFHNSFSIDGGVSLSRFSQFDDSLLYFGLILPRGNPNKSVSLDTSFGHQGGHPYKSVGIRTNYRFPNRIVASLAFNAQDHFEKSTQIIGNLNWDLGKNQYLSSRLVRNDKDYNIFFSFRKSGTLGTDYYLIVGDPNARSFKSTVILKVVYPFDIKF